MMKKNKDPEPREKETSDEKKKKNQKETDDTEKKKNKGGVTVTSDVSTFPMLFRTNKDALRYPEDPIRDTFQELHERRHSNIRLLRSSRKYSTHSKRFFDAKTVDNGGQVRIRSGGTQQRRQRSSITVAKKAVLDKNFLEESFQHRGRLSSQAKKLTKEQCIGKQSRKSTDCFNDAKSTITNTIEPEARSYADMIAMYSEAMYSKSAIAALKDNTSHTMMSRTHRSPFSPASIVSMKPFHAVGPSLLNQEANFSTETSAISSNYQKPRKNLIETIGRIETDPEKVSSYARIIERYSNTVSLNIDTRGWGNSMVPRRHVSTKLSNASMTLEDSKNNEASPREIIECSKRDGLTEARADSTSEKREVGQTGYIIKEPERIPATKDDSDAKLHPLEEQADWVDRVVKAHKKSMRNRKLANTGGKALEVSNENVASEMPAHFEMIEEQPQTEMTANKPTNPIAEYIRRGPFNSNQQGAGQTPSQGSAQSSATVTNPGREPQIELRMTPSHNESVVAINVDELSARTAGAKDELSVVISSKKNASHAVATDAQSDFGSMQISISEDTVPVKQIEFSINGKPVSELKSIVARADKLDVVSSMDKVEIRMPSKENRTRTAAQYNQQTARVATNPSAVLNLHINAKFNAPRMQQPRDAGVKPENAPPVVRSTPTNLIPPIPPKPNNIFTPIRQDNQKPDGTVATNVERPAEQFKNPEVNTEALATTIKKTTSNVAENMDKGMNQSVNSGTNPLPKSSPNTATTKIKNPKRDNVAENRVPSNMIPWWSSEEAFKKIKKKKSAAKGSSVEAEPNKTEVVVTEPKKPEAPLETKPISPPESAVTRIPEEPPKPVIPGNDAKQSDAAGKSSELLDLSTVRVTSSQRYVHGKPPKSAKQKNRMTKKVHRGRNVVKTSSVSKQSFDTQINSVPPPKVVKFVAVNPQTVDVETRPEAMSSDEKQRMKVEEETRKLEGDATRAGHENLQKNSDTVIKGADLEKSANRSAGVSANSASALGESGSDAAKGKAREEMSRTVEKGPSGERVFGRRMTEIMKTMKPIEKRKDGTLIDYGVTVPSRKPSETTQRRRDRKVHSALATKNIIVRPNNVEPEKTTKDVGPGQIEIVHKEKMSSNDVSNQSNIARDEKPAGKDAAKTNSATRQEIIDPVKISSVKKETLTEPIVVASQTKIDEPVKISSVKKLPASENKALPSQPESAVFERVSVTKTQTHRGPNNLPYVPRFNSEQMVPKKSSLLGIKEPGKSRDSPAKGFVTKVEKKPANTFNALATSDSKKLSGAKAKVQNTGDNTTSLKPKVSPMSARESSDKKEARTFFSKGSNVRSKSVSKKPRIQSCPATPRIDKKSEKISAENLDKHSKETGFAPFKGTIKRQPPKNNSVNFSNINEEKQATPKEDKSESGGGSTEFDSPSVGPGGLKKPRSFMMHRITTINNVPIDPVASVQNKGSKFRGEIKIDKMIHCQPYLAGTQSERPEKDLLYASWLQRFKSSVDDDKML